MDISQLYELLGFKHLYHIPKGTVQRRLQENKIEILQRTRSFKASYYSKVHNAHLKLASPILRQVWITLVLFCEDTDIPISGFLFLG